MGAPSPIYRRIYMTDVRAYLESKNIPLKQGGSNNVHTTCFFCGEDPSKRGRLYINVDPTADPPGLFQCKLCDERGALNKLKKYFGDPITMDGADSYNPQLSKIKNLAADYYNSLLLEDNDFNEPFVYLLERGISVESMERYKLGYANGTLHQYLQSQGYDKEAILETGLIWDSGNDYFDDHIIIPYHIAGTVSTLRGRAFGDQKAKYKSLSHDKPMLYNTDTVNQSERKSSSLRR